MGRWKVGTRPGRRLVIRTIHHLSATGGTVISKTIAAQPNTVLASEVGPFIGKPKFMPFDPVAQYLRQVPKRRRSDAANLFAERMRQCLRMAEEDGVVFIMRDYAHIDFLGAPSKTKPKGALVDLIDEIGIERRSVVTIRHPVDSWLSLQKNNWDKHVDDFDDYCVRSLAFLDAYEDCEIFRYEEFVAEPGRVVAAICAALAIDYSPDWTKRWAAIRLTGDSGRKSDTIEPRPRREMPAATAREIAASPAFARLAERSGYRRDFAREAVEMADALLAKNPKDASALRSREHYAALVA